MNRQRKLFRIEQQFERTASSVPGGAPQDARYDEMMREIRSLRSLLQRQQPQQARDDGDLLRAQLAEMMKLKGELELIYGAINKTKQELATIHVGGFQGPEMARVTRELDAVIGGTEFATQEILKAAEDIDEFAATLAAGLKNEHEHNLASDIQDRVIRILEACNFQDISGQRITKAMTTMRFIEEHVVRMMEIWGGIEALAGFAPEPKPEREGDGKLLNGPRLQEDAGHASQDDIDALFN